MNVSLTINQQLITGSVKDLKGLEIINVSGTPMEGTWDHLVRAYHYLGYEKIIGPRIKYLVLCENNPIAALSFNRAALHVGVRERYIDWDVNQRRKLLPLIVNNNRFLIVPWVKVKNLASYLLSKTLKLLKHDWKKLYGVTPRMVETFVDLKRHTGVCYRAANWLYLGETKGYGKVGKAFIYHGNRKGVYVYLLQKDWITQIREAPDHQPSKHDTESEATLMVLQRMDWNPKLMEEAGVTPENVFTLAPRLLSFMNNYNECFSHSAQRFNSNVYVKGLLSDMKRKSAEPIALRYVGSSGVRNLQYFTQKGAWDDELMSRIYQEKLSAELADPDGGMIAIDGSDFPKKGMESVGVARQYCGALGKVDNCQAAVFVGYTGEKGYCPIKGRLYLPELWFTDEYKERREKCGVPKDVKFKTKIEIASGMLCEIHNSGLFPAKWVGVDSAFSGNAFLDSLPDGLMYFADIACDTLVFTRMPDVAVPEYKGIGRKPVLPKPSFAPVAVKSIAEDDSIPSVRVLLGMGSKGPIYSNIKRLRVIRSIDGLPHLEAWLYIRQLADGSYKYSLSNAPADCPRETLDGLALKRWPIEQTFNECKDNLGMDHCESRSWNSFHRHLLLVFVAFLFLLIVRFVFSKKNYFNSTTSSNVGERFSF